jgi:hypothetical protein
VNLPVVPVVHVTHGGGDAAFGHHGVGLAEQRLADKTDRTAAGRGLDGGSKPRSSCADDEYVVFVCLIFGHHQILKSDHTPMEQSRTYRSAKPTEQRLHHAQTMCFRLRKLTHE